MLTEHLTRPVFAFRPSVITPSQATSSRHLRHPLLAQNRNLRDGHNVAAELKRYLEEDGHRIWGQVIYRCTYDNDREWQRLVERLQSEARNALELWNGVDLRDSFRLTIFEDRDCFDGTTTTAVREHFREWARTAPEYEQPPGVGPGLASRYEFCIMVDEAGLDSVVRQDPNDVLNGFVDLVTKDLVAVRADFTDDVDPDGEVNGFRINDFNWMRVNYRSVLVSALVYLRDMSSTEKWATEYRRPPAVSPL
ncbi:MAG: hypothetical protein FE78DRAFT_31087 [Acidomyces sp. 'richmondensis']|nr:MAG: hypothetical protein FE78DRAFT_31087 [Acidomyces sp. 'richmondensis']